MLAPESAEVREALARLPENPEPYPLTDGNDPASGKPILVYAPRDQAIMALVPGGEFLLGSAKEEALPEEKPQRKILLRPFYVDLYEVTNRRYALFVAQTGHAPPVHWASQKTPPAGSEDCPVTWVSHEDALAYVGWAGHRLPTELEWEKAARGTDGRTYPWGEDLPPAWLANINLPAPQKAMPVGMHPLGLSPYGCHDMVGNAQEWTFYDFLHYRYRGLEEGSEDPPAPTTGSFKVLRGGAFVDIAEFGRTTYRSFHKPDARTGLFGFRVARDVK
jgi:formylglycine-generating enzyme required for sulfatase activity